MKHKKLASLLLTAALLLSTGGTAFADTIMTHAKSEHFTLTWKDRRDQQLRLETTPAPASELPEMQHTLTLGDVKISNVMVMEPRYAPEEKGYTECTSYKGEFSDSELPYYQICVKDNFTIQSVADGVEFKIWESKVDAPYYYLSLCNVPMINDVILENIRFMSENIQNYHHPAATTDEPYFSLYFFKSYGGTSSAETYLIPHYRTLTDTAPIAPFPFRFDFSGANTAETNYVILNGFTEFITPNGRGGSSPYFHDLKMYPSEKLSSGWSKGLTWQFNFDDDKTYHSVLIEADRNGARTFYKVQVYKDDSLITNTFDGFIDDRHDISAGGIPAVTDKSSFPDKASAKPSSAKVLVDGKQMNFEAYYINGNNFFKLRDIAYAVNGTEKQFNVEWNGIWDRIDLKKTERYVSVGEEMKKGDGKSKTAVKTSSDITYIHTVYDTSKGPVSVITAAGEWVERPGSVLRNTEWKLNHMLGYKIGGNNFFMLRDLGSIMDFDVSWDAANKCITIDTTHSYNPNT